MKDEITKIAIFDFDGTLIKTMEPIEGKKIWKDKTGKDYPHRGWWGKRETLDIDIFENEPFDDIVNELNKAIDEPNTFVALCTGRISPMKKEVQAILDKHGFEFDDVILNGDKRFVQKGKGGDNNTLAYKVRVLGYFASEFPNVEEIEMWDDRVEHNSTFDQWGRFQKNIKVRINLVHQ